MSFSEGEVQERKENCVGAVGTWLRAETDITTPAGSPVTVLLPGQASLTHGEKQTGLLSDWMRFIQQILIFLSYLMI